MDRIVYKRMSKKFPLPIKVSVYPIWKLDVCFEPMSSLEDEPDCGWVFASKELAEEVWSLFKNSENKRIEYDREFYENEFTEQYSDKAELVIRPGFQRSKREHTIFTSIKQWLKITNSTKVKESGYFEVSGVEKKEKTQRFEATNESEARAKFLKENPEFRVTNVQAVH